MKTVQKALDDKDLKIKQAAEKAEAALAEVCEFQRDALDEQY